jgi:crossover junction endodeoxyribonuclease RusA
MDSTVENLLVNAGQLGLKENGIVIPLDQPAPYMTMNQRKHWTWNAKTKRAWRDAAFYAACAWRMDFDARRLNHKAVIRFIFPVTSNRRRDPHNYYPTIKPIIDGLTDANLWPDDTPQYVETREPVFGKCESVYIIIEEQ